MKEKRDAANEELSIEATVVKFKNYVKEKHNREATPEEILRLTGKLAAQKFKNNVTLVDKTEMQSMPPSAEQSKKALEMLDAAIEKNMEKKNDSKN